MHLVQTEIDLMAACRHAAQFHPYTAHHDVDFVLKTVLTDGLRGAVLRPWAVMDRIGPVVRVAAYSASAPDQIEVRQDILPAPIIGVPMPELCTGQRIAFTVRLCPTIRTTTGERDMFLVEVEKAGRDAGLRREVVYTAYLRSRLPGTVVEALRMDGFRLLKAARKSAGTPSGIATHTLPEAILTGLAVVCDPPALLATLATGVGRQRAYGFGMVRFSIVSAV